MADVALVTGAGSGLGAVIAERLAREGLTVAVNTRARTEEADAVAAAIRAGGGSAFAVTANVTDPSAVRRMFETIADQGTLRVLVNNASYRPRQRVQAITEDDWHQVRSVTLDGAFRCIRCALPALIPGGRIVNILGRNALAGDPERVHLSAAKHGLLGLTLALAAALRDDGVAVNAVSPGMEADVTEDLELRCRAEIASAGRTSGLRRCQGAHRNRRPRRLRRLGRQRAYGVVSASIASTSPPSRSAKVASANRSARSRPSTPSARPWNFSRSSSSVSLLPGVPRA